VTGRHTAGVTSQTTGQPAERMAVQLVHGCAGHAGEPVWLLTTSAGEWVAECGHPGCGWTVSDLVADLVDDLAAGHVLTHRSHRVSGSAWGVSNSGGAA
jgi:hypothetical protein